MRKYLKENYNVSECARIIRDARNQLSDIADILDWTEIECEDIKNGELDYYGDQTLERYARAIYSALYDLSTALSSCYDDFHDFQETDIDDV